MTVRIRRAVPADIPALVSLCGEHAHYERASFDPADKAEGLRNALFGAAPSLHAWVAEIGGDAIGYATATVDFSTWSCKRFVHMDCLFVREGIRGQGVGALLVRTITEHARACGVDELQWQTPIWNEGAARFYARLGAACSEKLRFVLGV